jgi:photosystem II stability/assembly factor-like uncharacterized protein
VIAVSGCQRKHDPPSDPPANVSALEGDGVVLLSWDPLPGLTYWIFYRQGITVTAAEPGSIAVKNAQEPRAVTGLLNDTQYAFVMNATDEDSAAGPSSPVVIPNKTRLAGDSWTIGAPIGVVPQNMNALAFGGTRYVAVGDAGAILAGDFAYGSASPNLGVASWMQPQGLPTNFTENLRSVTFNGTFVALGENGSVLTSADGVNWVVNVPITAAGAPVTGMNGIAFGPGIFVAVGNGGQLFTSNNLAASWVKGNSNTTEDLTSVVLLNGGLFATGTKGTLLVSPDGGTTWNPQATGLGTTLRAVTFMPNAPPPNSVSFVAVGDAGSVVTSTSVIAGQGTWTPTVLPGAQNLRSVTVGGTTGFRFMAVGLGGAVVFGDSVIDNVPVNSIQWLTPIGPTPTADLSSVLFFLGQYLAVGAAGANAVSH